jgi:transposase
VVTSAKTPPSREALEHAHYERWNNPENRTTRQQAKLAWIATTDGTLHRGLPLTQSTPPGLPARLPRSRRGPRSPHRLGPPLPYSHLRGLAGRIVKPRASILADIEHGLSNGRIKPVNAKIRLTTRVAFGFRSPDASFALAVPNLGGHRPVLPGGHRPVLPGR